jgi:spore germination cell wall hydrolase CwlJ-like protein
MYSSPSKMMNKNWKVIVATFSIIFIWQSLSLQPLIGTVKAQSIAETSPTVIAATPVITKEQELHNSYQHAKFLAVVNTSEKVPHNKTDLFCLAKNIFHEAGNQPIVGKLAVAQVTINRTKDPKFAGRICDVVLARNQFSWANNHHKRWTHPYGEQWEESVKIAQEVLEEGTRVKGMENALYYHADYVNPHWHHVRRLAQIGAHIFYVRNA